MQMNKISALILGLCVFLGLVGMGSILGKSAIKYKEYEHTVRVKGLSEREMPADIVIWPVRYTRAGNDLSQLINQLESDASTIRSFLTENGIAADDITIGTPDVTDKVAQSYDGKATGLRYAANQTITVYSKNIDAVRNVMTKISALGKQGIIISGDEYGYNTEYLFTGLNEIKPEMVEESTRKAREVAEKFAADSDSRLGNIKSASQGQFSIYARDKNNPHIKKVRVVSTVEYYLAD